MGAVGNQRKNIVEWGRQFHRGEFMPEVQMLAQENQCVMDALFQPCNDGTTHLYRVQTALPTVQATAFGEGSPISKGASAQERAHCAMLTGFASVEEELSKIGGAQAQARAAEDANFAESLKQAFAEQLIYGNRSSNIRHIDGVCTLFNDKSGPKAKQFFNCGGATANGQTTAVLLNWGPDVYCTFPEGTAAGYMRQDLGRQVKTLASGNQLVTLDTKHTWHIGFVNEAWQSIARICNIDVAQLQAMSGNQTATSALNVLNGMLTLRKRIRRPGRKVWYVNETVWTWLMRCGMEKSSSAVKVEEAATQFGTFEQMTVFGTPVRLVDRILNTMAVI